MKLAFRIFAFAVVIAGAAAASFSSNTRGFVSHQSATAAIPVPGCGPGMGCPATGK